MGFQHTSTRRRKVNIHTEASHSLHRVLEPNEMKAYFSNCCKYMIQHAKLANLAVKRARFAQHKGHNNRLAIFRPTTVANHVWHSQNMMKKLRQRQKKVIFTGRPTSMDDEELEPKMRCGIIPVTDLSGTMKFKRIKSTLRKRERGLQWKSILSIWKNRHFTE